jgi:hypothetical protein
MLPLLSPILFSNLLNLAFSGLVKIFTIRTIGLRGAMRAKGAIFLAATAGCITTVQTCVSAAAKILGGADPMAALVMGDGAPAEGDAPTEDDRDEAADEVENPVGRGPDKVPTKNSQ